MPPISIMLKPASSACNLACKYCFYHSLSDARELGCRPKMSLGLFENIMRKAFAFANGAPVWLSFQGGEPLLAGKEFFKKALKLARDLNEKCSPLSIGIQTNGTLVDEEWCELFKEFDVLVGLSIDGDCDGNALRVYPDGGDSFYNAQKAQEYFLKAGVKYNVLCVVTKPFAERIEEIYAYFKRMGVRFLQFIPCLKPLDGDARGETFYLSGEEYGEFLKRAFALYAKDFVMGGYVSVRLFDNIVRMAAGEKPEQCGVCGHCNHQYVIESDGEVFPCDFFCVDEWSIGNIKEYSFSELEKTDKAMDFIKDSLKKEDKCKECEFYRLCAGGCKRERLSFDLCAANKIFFSAALPTLKFLSRAVVKK